MGDEPNHPVKPDPSEQAIFAEALQRESPGARAAYLESACGADTALRRGVETLLWAAENAGDFLEIPPSLLSGDAVPTPLGSEPSERPGDRIGRYKLLEKIGEGGCGVVYMAEQEEPMRRRVALKVIKFGMDTAGQLPDSQKGPMLSSDRDRLPGELISVQAAADERVDIVGVGGVIGRHAGLSGLV